VPVLVLVDYRAAGIHARSASSRLEAFGDAGIFEDHRAELQRTLTSQGESLDAPGTKPEPLTDRELQILTLLQSDLSLCGIGSELFISRTTVKSHITSIDRKLGVTSLTAAIARGRQLDMI